MTNPPLPSIPYDSFGPELEKLIEAMSNRLEYDPPAALAPYGPLRMLLLGFLRTTQTTYRAIKYLTADLPVNPVRKPEFILAVPPLTRTILDTLFTVVFLFGKPRYRTKLYLRAGWGQLQRDYDELFAKHGSHAEWAPFFTTFSTFLRTSALEWKIPATIIDHSTPAPRWPNPGRMPGLSTSPDRKALLEYLNDAYYRELSQDSHLALPGLFRRSWHSLLPATDEIRADALHRQKASIQAMTFVLLTALVTELELELAFGYRERVTYVWGILNPHLDVASELYAAHYARLLAREQPGT